MLSQPAIDPIISRLRPRSVQEILDQAFRLYRRYFLTFLAITAVVFVPVNMVVQLLNVALQGNNATLQRSTLSNSSFSSSDTLNQELITILVLSVLVIGLSIIGGLLQYLSQGALTSAVADSHLDRPVSFGGAYRAMLKRVGPLLGAIGLQILIGIGIFLPAIAVFLLSIASLAGDSSGAGAGLAFICLGFLLMLVGFIFYAYITVRITVIVPVIMVEHLGPVQALRRSWQLVQGYWWRTLALVLVLSLINAVISAGPAYLLTLIVGMATRSFDPVLTAAVTAVVTIITEALFIPLSLTAYTLYYFDLRVRKEGFDIETAVSQRYSYPGGPAAQSAAPGTPGGYYPGQGQYAPAGGYSPPPSGYVTPAQPQYPAYIQPVYGQGYQYPQQGYSPPQTYPQPDVPSPGAVGLGGAPTLPTSLAAGTAESPPIARVGPDTGPLETPRVEGLGLTTPSISEQAAQPPDAEGYNPPEADTLDTGSDGPTPPEQR
jgi:hypothetical protein